MTKTYPAEIVLGDGIVSIQVHTDELPGRPFPANAVIADISDDGKFYSLQVCKKLRAQIISQVRKQSK